MTNPNNAIGTNGAYSGRTSVNALNDNLAVYSGRGILSGWATAPSSGLTVALGGDSTTRDVAIAEDNAGNKTTINNISGNPVSVTISAAPSTNSRIDLIVAYVENPPQGSSDKVDNYEACGLIVVEGTVASSPSAPSEADIRSAITADGATGSTAYYVILSSITITSGTTDITSDMIESGGYAGVGANNIDFATFGRFSRYIDGTQTIPANTATTLQLDSMEISDVGCSYASQTVTIQSAGVWQIDFGARVSEADNAAFGIVVVQVNGTAKLAASATAYANSTNNRSCHVCGGGLLSLEAGDQLTLVATLNVAMTNSSMSHQHMSGHLVALDS